MPPEPVVNKLSHNATRWFHNPDARRWRCASPSDAATTFHASLPDYEPTRLTELPPLARELGVRAVFVKDESTRFGLPAFKALGVSYAILRILAARNGISSDTLTFSDLLRLSEQAGGLEFVTATDGNHGQALARCASTLGMPTRVVVPAGLDPITVEAIAAEGAQVIVARGDYDAAVRHAAAVVAARPDAVLVQDTAWTGYRQVPQWIVDGYATMFAEIDNQLAAAAAQPPTLVVVPVGVGSLAQAAITHYRSRVGARPTALLAVEPDSAACVQASLHNGTQTTVLTGSTLMAGLNCGTPSMSAWPYLRDGLDAAVTVSDAKSVAAGADLARLGVPAGPCGAASLAAARLVTTGAAAVTRRGDLGIDPGATVVLLNTDGRRSAAS